MTLIEDVYYFKLEMDSIGYPRVKLYEKTMKKKRWSKKLVEHYEYLSNATVLDKFAGRYARDAMDYAKDLLKEYRSPILREQLAKYRGYTPVDGQHEYS